MQPDTGEAIAAGLDATSEAPGPLALDDVGQGEAAGDMAPAPVELESLDLAGNAAEAPAPAPLERLEMGADVGKQVGGEGEAAGGEPPPPSPEEGPEGILDVGQVAAQETEPPAPLPLEQLERIERGG